MVIPDPVRFASTLVDLAIASIELLSKGRFVVKGHSNKHIVVCVRLH
jgi:hypothetical protein